MLSLEFRRKSLKDRTEEQIKEAYITVIRQLRFHNNLEEWESFKLPFEERLIEFGIEPAVVIEEAGLTEPLAEALEDIKRTGRMRKEETND